METYIAVLRGINVSGKNIVKMDALRKHFADVGFSNVKTYIQSGNIVFQNKKETTKKLETKIIDLIKKQFSFDIPVLVKEINEWKTIAQKNPFTNDKSKAIEHLHVTFLSGKPDDSAVEKIKENSWQSDEFIVTDNAIYLYCPNGYGNTKLTNTFWENKLKLKATTRNWKTVNELINMAEML
ncbi:hypothetical protein A9P82_04150 [Arachidicoccus ginsenosidimutans]|uniref:DUF1697 domain-containing protein n=1 Tax=Arachidicoccus sp. BS20 TaxID=1850526 RepID=UPI0007F062C0|nr:DUF1697 domain-containing protein [Arachidicoccus sp. BS20]ANI88556.1 hypothetical protein A9P82_04150 [Arachidicoccus sp. BS20]